MLSHFLPRNALIQLHLSRLVLGRVELLPRGFELQIRPILRRLLQMLHAVL